MRRGGGVACFFALRIGALGVWSRIQRFRGFERGGIVDGDGIVGFWEVDAGWAEGRFGDGVEDGQPHLGRGRGKEG